MLQKIVEYMKDNVLLSAVLGALVLIIIVLIIIAIIHSAKKSKAKKQTEISSENTASEIIPAAESESSLNGEVNAEHTANAPQAFNSAATDDVLQGKDKQDRAQEQSLAAVSDAEAPQQPAATAEQKPEHAATLSAGQTAASASAAAEGTAPSGIVSHAEPADQSHVAAEQEAEFPASSSDTADTSATASERRQTPARRTSGAGDVQTNDTDDDEDGKKYTGKWVILRNESTGSYHFELLASNGEKLLSSIDYTSAAGAKNGIKTHKAGIANNNFVIARSKNNQYFFKLLSNSNRILCTGETYKTKTRCENAIESVKRFAETAIVTVVKDQDE